MIFEEILLEIKKEKIKDEKDEKQLFTYHLSSSCDRPFFYLSFTTEEALNFNDKIRITIEKVEKERKES